MPAQNNLARRFPVGGGDFYDGRMLHEFAPEQRSPRHEPYAVFPAVCAQITLLIKRVQLDLVEYGETAERASDFLQMFDLEIGYANPADESFLTSPQKFFVCAETLVSDPFPASGEGSSPKRLFPDPAMIAQGKHPDRQNGSARFSRR